MEHILTIFIATIPVFLLVGIGGFLRRGRVIHPSSDSMLMGLAIHLFMPALILHTLLLSPSIQTPRIAILSIGTGFTIVTITTLIAFGIAPILGLKKGSGQRTFGLSTGIQNYGYFAIPIVDALFPEDGAGAILFLHNTGVEIALWTVGLMLLTGKFQAHPRMLVKGPIIAVFLGLILCFTGATPHIPEAIMVTLDMLGQCALPIALLLIGCSIYDLLGKEKISWKVGLGSSLLRLIGFPALILSIVYSIDLPLPLQQVLVVQAALPAAMFPIVLTKHYGGQVHIAVQVVLATTLLSIISLPIILWLGTILLQ